MEYLLKQTKKKILTILITLLVVISISGCGMATTADIGFAAKNKAITTAEAVNDSSKDNNKDTAQLNKVPVYGKKQKAKIKKYLSSLPDTITVKEAKKRGIIIYDIKKSQFKKQWMDFYNYVRTGEKQYNPKNPTYEVLGYAEPYNRRAITILYYTVEGDACYTYLSFINGKYYMLNDSSRDNFKAGSWDGYSDLMTYKSLRKYKRRKNAKSTEFYLFKKQNISRKKVKKIIANSGYNYVDDYYSVFELNI